MLKESKSELDKMVISTELKLYLQLLRRHESQLWTVIDIFPQSNPLYSSHLF